MPNEKAARIANRFGDLFFQSFVATSAEKAFQMEVKRFTTHFTPAHVEAVAQRGILLEDLVKKSGFGLKPTAAKDLNAWQRHLLSLGDDKLLALVREAVSPAHVAALDRYPLVAKQLIAMVRGMVRPS